MIIISQEKDRIINFDNLIQIYITAEIYVEEEKSEINKYYIRYEDCNNSYEDIGTYKTEERAKEILQEIIRNYSIYYEMPKE